MNAETQLKPDSLQYLMGWIQVLALIKDRITTLREKTASAEAQQSLDEVFDFIKMLEQKDLKLDEEQ